MIMDRSDALGKLLDDFFGAIMDERFSEAERILNEINEKIVLEDEEFKRGFMRGLKGILIMQRSKEQYTFLSTLKLNDPNYLRECYEEFSRGAKNRLRLSYDRGYFSALAEFVHFLLRNIKSNMA